VLVLQIEFKLLNLDVFISVLDRQVLPQNRILIPKSLHLEPQGLDCVSGFKLLMSLVSLKFLEVYAEFAYLFLVCLRQVLFFLSFIHAWQQVMRG